MNTYNYIKAFLCLVVLLSLTACQDWLDETPTTQIQADDQFASPQGFKDVLIGVYIGMTDQGAYAMNMTWGLVDILSQQYNIPSTSRLSPAERYAYRSSTSLSNQVDAIWTHSYKIIANINLALEYIENGVLGATERDLIKGELLGLRAYLHFDLLRLYGYGNLAARTELLSARAIPYVTEFTKNATAPLDYEETFALLFKDLEEAAELLKTDPIYAGEDKPEVNYTEINREGFYDFREQRMNYYATRALMARAYTWLGGVDNLARAAEAAQEVINFSGKALIDPATYPVSNDPVLYQEIIFCLDVDAMSRQASLGGYMYGSYFNTDDPANSLALYLLPGEGTELYEADNPEIGVVDIRFNTLLELQSRGYVSIKMLQQGMLHFQKLPLLKLPEMYYIIAEYNLENGQSNEAVNVLNTVRSSRGILEEIPQGLEAERVREELYNEYRKEYVVEGQLFYFFKRWGVEDIPFSAESRVMTDEEYVLPYPDQDQQLGN